MVSCKFVSNCDKKFIANAFTFNVTVEKQSSFSLYMLNRNSAPVQLSQVVKSATV